MKIKRTIALALALLTLLVFAACNVAGSLYSEKNAYVSVYVYGENGKTLLSTDAIRVAPLEEETTAEETTEGGLLTEEAARQRYRTTPTGMYALELCITNKDKNAELPTVIVSQFQGEIEYSLDSVLGCTAGKASGSNDIYEWECKVNDVVVDPFKTKLENYDKVVFSFVERTYRTFTATFEINNGAETLISETKFNVNGEKADMNIANYLNSDYLDDKTGEPVQPVKTKLGITLSEDGKRVVKIGDLENDETHHWICYIGDIEDGTVSDLSDTRISERLTISFEYRDLNAEETEGQEDDEETDE
ncbi:MAG: hypothetical protein IJT49_02060 [Clostridia bacterium]|nr:hypothetical protein [Clostridia bacterium]